MSARLKTMKELATIEAKKLKQFATPGEIASLDIDKMNPSDETGCIYGQMTGHCNSVRAIELIKKCCERIYDARNVIRGIDRNARLNGAPFDVAKIQLRHTNYQSPIEMLIYDSNGGIRAREKIVRFLKGKTKTLSL